MNTINQTNDNLKRIQAKATLGLCLTDREKALQTLYGQSILNANAVRSDININKTAQEINASLFGARQ